MTCANPTLKVESAVGPKQTAGSPTNGRRRETEVYPTASSSDQGASSLSSSKPLVSDLQSCNSTSSESSLPTDAKLLASIASSKAGGCLTRADLFDYQNRIVDFAKDVPRCGLLIDMGLGKSVSTLTAISDLIETFMVRRVLVIAPKRVAMNTWPDELANWSHLQHLTYTQLCAPLRTREKRLSEDTDIHIINRENVTWLATTLRKQWPYDMVVVDESSSFKSAGSKRFRALKKIMPFTDRVVLLTGTPCSNGLLDLWSQIYLLDSGQRLKKTVTSYKRAYFDSDYMGWNWTPKEDAFDQIQERISDVCLSMTADDYLELPPRIDNTIKITLPPKAKKLYQELEDDFLSAVDDETDVTAFNAAALTNKLLQVANGAVYIEDDEGERSTHHVHDEKLDALASIIEEAAGEPVLVAYSFISDFERIQARFPHARTADDNAVADFNAGKVPLLVVHPASAGHGLNLQYGGHIAVWFGLNWSLELYQQFNARLHRQGQTKPVFIHHIVADGTADETVLDALHGKNVTQKALLAALKADIEKGRV